MVVHYGTYIEPPTFHGLYLVFSLSVIFWLMFWISHHIRLTCTNFICDCSLLHLEQELFYLLLCVHDNVSWTEIDARTHPQQHHPVTPTPLLYSIAWLAEVLRAYANCLLTLEAGTTCSHSMGSQLFRTTFRELHTMRNVQMQLKSL